MKKHSRLCLLGSLIMIAGLLLAAYTPAGAKPKYGGILMQGAQFPPSSPDIQQSRGGPSRSFPGPYGAWLFEADLSGKINPALAESWDFDGKTLTINLRKGVKFQDGTDFNAEAVKFNLDRVGGKTEPKIVSPGRSAIRRFESIEVLDPYTITIHLKAPYAAMLLDLSAWPFAMVSPAAVKKWGEAFPQHPVSCGPFVLKEWASESHAVYERWDGYWKKDEAGNKLPYIDRMKIVIIPDAAAASAALRSGSIDIHQGVGITQAKILKKNPKIKVVTLEGSYIHFLEFNTGKPPLDNIWLRKAINYAINYQEVIAAYTMGEGRIPTQFLGPVQWAHDPTLKWYEYNPEKAKEALKKGNHPKGFKFTATNHVKDRMKLAEVVQAQLKRIGIDMQIDQMDIASVNNAFRKGQTHNAAFTGSPLTGYDPGFLLWVWHHSKGPYTDPSKPTVYDALLDRSAKLYNMDERKKVLGEVQQKIYERASACLLAWMPLHRAFRTYVKGYRMRADTNSTCEEVWLDK